jgi:hypothetical protein
MSRIQPIAAKCVERAAALHLKGKRRDDAALDFFVGAAAGAELAGDTALAPHIGMTAAMLVSVRGYLAIAELPREKDAAA